MTHLHGSVNYSQPRMEPSARSSQRCIFTSRYFLASDDASYVADTLLFVDGGYSAM